MEQAQLGATMCSSRPGGGTAEYEKYAKKPDQIRASGLLGRRSTQTTDVEGEVNGLFTYDRKVMKVLPERLKAANKAVIESMPLDME